MTYKTWLTSAHTLKSVPQVSQRGLWYQEWWVCDNQWLLNNHRDFCTRLSFRGAYHIDWSKHFMPSIYPPAVLDGVVWSPLDGLTTGWNKWKGEEV